MSLLANPWSFGGAAALETYKYLKCKPKRACTQQALPQALVLKNPERTNHKRTQQGWLHWNCGVHGQGKGGMGPHWLSQSSPCPTSPQALPITCVSSHACRAALVQSWP